MKNIDLSSPAVVLFVGACKKGKTNALKFTLLKHSLDNFYGSAKFEFGLVFSRSKFTGEYDFIENQDYVHENYDEEVLMKYVDGLKNIVESGKEAPPNFVVFDDMIGLLNMKQNTFFTNFISTHRKTNTCVFLATQHLKTGSSTTLREITTHAIVFSSKQLNTIQSLFENFGQLFSNIGEFKDNFFDITKEKYTAMLYLQDADNINDNYMIYKAPDVSQWDYVLNY